MPMCLKKPYILHTYGLNQRNYRKMIKKNESMVNQLDQMILFHALSEDEKTQVRISVSHRITQALVNYYTNKGLKPGKGYELTINYFDMDIKDYKDITLIWN